MEAYLWILYGLISGAAVIQALLLLLQTWEHRRFVRSSMTGWERHQPTGRVLICAPCKGRDLHLEDNLRALLEQDYDDYEVSFIVESGDDPACPIIRQVMAGHPWIRTRLVVAGRAAENGQKVHNLRIATARLSPNVEYLAFFDSDARPAPQWLRMLISRLKRPNMGAMTGYRWFVPLRNSPANNLIYSINCNAMSLLGRKSHHLLWGGSWAIRREVWDKIHVHSAWKDTLCDDFVARRLLSAAGLQVRFEPACVVASPVDYSLFEALSFLRRQYLLCRFYGRNWWIFAVLTMALANLAWLGNLGALAWTVISGANWAWAPASVIIFLYASAVCRGKMRQDLTDIYFPHLRGALRQSKLFDIFLQPMTSLIHGVIVVSAGFGRQVSWRAVSYRLNARGKVIRCWRGDDPALLPMPGAGRDAPQWIAN